ncbi:MAG: hypothetical protein LBT67_00900 [Holosporaceae bacterium]|jgi:hypothetical protein|nr:hypothetical protein [Holosporaceae bacterium]
MIYNPLSNSEVSVSNEERSILDEIDEELQHDKQMLFLKKHKKPIIYTVVVIAVGILAYSSWHTRKQKHLEDITNALMGAGVSTKNNLLLKELSEEAPVELKPFLMILKSGSQMMAGEFAEENLSPLLELSTRPGVDVIWRDLALLIYASYPVKTSIELVRLLEPLTSDDRPFRFMAMELIGAIQEYDGNHAAALEIFDKIVSCKDVPESIKRRIIMISSYIKNGEEKQS